MNLLWGLSVPLSNMVRLDLGGHSKYCLAKSAMVSVFIAGVYWYILKMKHVCLCFVLWQPHTSPSAVGLASLQHFHTPHFLSLSLLGRSLISNNSSYRNCFPLLMLLSWEALIRKMVIHSTNMCKKFCWVHRDGEWLLPPENSHPSQRERWWVEKKHYLKVDGDEKPQCPVPSLEIIASLGESGWVSWLTWHL